MNLPTINYLPVYQPLVKNCNQKIIQNFVLVNRGGTSFHQNIQASPAYQQNLRWETGHLQVGLRPVNILQPYYQHAQKSNMVTITHVHMMTVKQTANWIRTFGVHKGWNEAAAYAKIFSKNNIKGSMLKYLNHEILKFDMGMSNHLHRVCLLVTIRQLFPAWNYRKVVSEPTRLSDLGVRDIKYDHCQKTLASPMAGSADPLTEKLCTLQCLLPDKDPSGMDISSVQNSNKSARVNSCSDMKYDESKCHVVAECEDKLQDGKIILLSAQKHM